MGPLGMVCDPRPRGSVTLHPQNSSLRIRVLCAPPRQRDRRDCLDPPSCPVRSPENVDLRKLRLAHIPRGTTFHTVYRRAHWPSLFNDSPYDNARFSSIQGSGGVVPTLYGAATQTVALLESCLHGAHETGAKIISQALDLASRGLVALTTAVDFSSIDLTNEGLARVGLMRAELVATSPAHYACTREWPIALHGRRVGGVAAVGLLWQSRIAELAQADSLLLAGLLNVASEVFVLFGDRVPTEPRLWLPGDPHYANLTIGVGLHRVELIAEQIGCPDVPN